MTSPARNASATRLPRSGETPIRRCLFAFGLALALVGLSACGGDDAAETTFENLAEAAGQDIDDIDLDTESGDFSASIGDADVAFGGDRPDWLEDEFALPEDLDIQLAVNDPSTGERAIQGSVPGGQADSIRAEQRANLQSIGYEQLGDSGIFVHPDRMPLELTVEAGQGEVYFAMTHRFEDEQTLRDVYAPVEGEGTLTATIDGEVMTFTGSCELRSDSGNFSSDDGTANFAVEVREGEQDYILGNITNASADAFQSWNVLQVDDAGNYPTIEVRPDGFSFAGFFTDFSGSDPAAATVDVSCAG